MNNGLAPADWSAFFLAAAIVGGALAGSIAIVLAGQVRAIAARPGAVARAAEAIVLPLAAALIGLAGLWPADTPGRIGIGIAVVGAGSWLVLVGMLVRRLPGAALAVGRRTLPRLVIGQLATLPTIAGGVLLAVTAVPGLDPLVIGVGASVVGGPWLGALLLLDLSGPTATTPTTAPAAPAAPVVPRPEPTGPEAVRPEASR